MQKKIWFLSEGVQIVVVFTQPIMNICMTQNVKEKKVNNGVDLMEKQLHQIITRSLKPSGFSFRKLRPSDAFTKCRKSENVPLVLMRNKHVT